MLSVLATQFRSRDGDGDDNQTRPSFCSVSPWWWHPDITLSSPWHHSVISLSSAAWILPLVAACPGWALPSYRVHDCGAGGCSWVVSSPQSLHLEISITGARPGSTDTGGSSWDIDVHQYICTLFRERASLVPSLECWNHLLAVLHFKDLWRCLNTISPPEIRTLVHRDLYGWAVWGIIFINLTTCQWQFCKCQCSKCTKCQNWGTITDTLPAQATSSTSQNGFRHNFSARAKLLLL